MILVLFGVNGILLVYVLSVIPLLCSDVVDWVRFRIIRLLRLVISVGSVRRCRWVWVNWGLWPRGLLRGRIVVLV